MLQLDEVELPPPGKGEITVGKPRSASNYIDTIIAPGSIPCRLPSGIGLEAAGVVEAVGEGVTGLKPGDRVAYGTGTVGAYAEKRNFRPTASCKLPDGVTDETAAAMMLKGMTVRYLLRATYKVQARRHHPVSCGCRRRRPHRLPVGEGARRQS